MAFGEDGFNEFGLEADQLRVFRNLDESKNHLKEDFTILGFKKISPLRSRGIKLKAEYRCPIDNALVVEKIFVDILHPDGLLKDLQITFNWYNELGEIGDSKTEIAKSYEKDDAITEMRRRWNRQLDYLIGQGFGTAVEPYIDIVFDAFAIEEQKYRSHGSTHLDNGINAAMQTAMASGTPEQQQLYGILHFMVPRSDVPDKFISIGNSIRYQIGGVGTEVLV